MSSVRSRTAVLAQIPVGEEAELERRDRALDRHVDEVHDEPAAVEVLERRGQRGRALEAVEREDRLVPARAGHALGLLREQAGAGGDDEDVVVEHRAVGEVDGTIAGLDPVDLGADEPDALVQLGAARPDDGVRVGKPERDEEQPGLVDVAVVLVDDGDRGVIAEEPAEPVGDERPAGAPAEDDDAVRPCRETYPPPRFGVTAETPGRPRESHPLAAALPGSGHPARRISFHPIMRRPLATSGSRRIATIVVLGALGLFLLAQAVPYGRAHADPPTTQALKFDSASTEKLFAGACGDCHSNHTTWPWYTNVAPASWLVQHDVDDGRGVFNVSEWNKPQPEIGDIVEQISSGEMPPLQYKPLHSGARLSSAQKQELITGLTRSYAADPPAATRGGG